MKINIKNTIYDVSFVDSIDRNDEYVGLTQTDTKKIYIKKDQTKHDLKDTIAHELAHAYVYECGHYLTREDDEAFATFVGREFEEMQENYIKILKGSKRK